MMDSSCATINNSSAHHIRRHGRSDAKSGPASKNELSCTCVVYTWNGRKFLSHVARQERDSQRRGTHMGYGGVRNKEGPADSSPARTGKEKRRTEVRLNFLPRGAGFYHQRYTCIRIQPSVYYTCRAARGCCWCS